MKFLSRLGLAFALLSLSACALPVAPNGSSFPDPVESASLSAGNDSSPELPSASAIVSESVPSEPITEEASLSDVMPYLKEFMGATHAYSAFETRYREERERTDEHVFLIDSVHAYSRSRAFEYVSSFVRDEYPLESSITKVTDLEDFHYLEWNSYWDVRIPAEDTSDVLGYRVDHATGEERFLFLAAEVETGFNNEIADMASILGYLLDEYENVQRGKPEEDYRSFDVRCYREKAVARIDFLMQVSDATVGTKRSDFSFTVSEGRLYRYCHLAKGENTTDFDSLIEQAYSYVDDYPFRAPDLTDIPGTEFEQEDPEVWEYHDLPNVVRLLKEGEASFDPMALIHPWDDAILEYEMYTGKDPLLLENVELRISRGSHQAECERAWRYDGADTHRYEGVAVYSFGDQIYYGTCEGAHEGEAAGASELYGENEDTVFETGLKIVARQPLEALRQAYESFLQKVVSDFEGRYDAPECTIKKDRETFYLSIYYTLENNKTYGFVVHQEEGGSIDFHMDFGKGDRDETYFSLHGSLREGYPHAVDSNKYEAIEVTEPTPDPRLVAFRDFVDALFLDYEKNPTFASLPAYHATYEYTAPEGFTESFVADYDAAVPFYQRSESGSAHAFFVHEGTLYEGNRAANGHASGSIYGEFDVPGTFDCLTAPCRDQDRYTLSLVRAWLQTFADQGTDGNAELIDLAEGETSFSCAYRLSDRRKSLALSFVPCVSFSIETKEESIPGGNLIISASATLDLDPIVQTYAPEDFDISLPTPPDPSPFQDIIDFLSAYEIKESKQFVMVETIEYLPENSANRFSNTYATYYDEAARYAASHDVRSDGWDSWIRCYEKDDVYHFNGYDYPVAESEFDEKSETYLERSLNAQRDCLRYAIDTLRQYDASIAGECVALDPEGKSFRVQGTAIRENAKDAEGNEGKGTEGFSVDLTLNEGHVVAATYSFSCAIESSIETLRFEEGPFTPSYA